MAEVTKEETLKKIEELVSEMKDKAFNAYFLKNFEINSLISAAI